ncbi:cell division protein FtsX [Enhygromyxa salina]|uniref:Cell division protein FtsX n=1 Tax=Enhygromyxa salina TaxID=215803 RepID=A0A2S9YTT0_9BACT|nr:ABC transporter permease [Enhygromyxa salina]PRQ08494.1 Cell division protein FtsX [Enhygromyxa salina]
MPATERQLQVEMGLEIAVSDSPQREPAREATISLFPGAWVNELQDHELEDHEDEWDEDFEDVLLEASDLIEVEAARTGAGLPALGAVEPEADDPAPEDTIQDRILAEETVQARVEDPAEFEAEVEIDPEPEAEVAEPEPEPEPDPDPEPELQQPAARQSTDPIRVPAWSGVNGFAYVVSRGLRGMGQSPLVQLLAIGTMAVCMLLLGTTMLIFQNAQRVAHDLGVDSPVTVYMQPGVDPAVATELRERIAALPEVERAVRVTPEIALERLQAGLGQGADLDAERAELLAGVDASTLPDSIELSLIAGVEPGFADALATRVQAMDGVDEVAVLGPWVQQVESMLTTLRWLAFGVAALVSLACLAIVWSTIRLGVFARRSEIHILRLVGGTARFVRGPFLIEGVLQGVLGTALALACLWLSFELVRPFLERGMSLMFAAGSLHFFTTVQMIVALGFGALLGVIGSRAAVARHTEA